MAMWPSRTNLWGKKTRPVNLKAAVRVANGNATGKDFRENEDYLNDKDYLEDEDKIKSLETKIDFLKSLLGDKCSEILELQTQLKDNTQFMQKVVLELIQLKSAPVSAPLAPKTSLEKYIENKNAGPKGKLP